MSQFPRLYNSKRWKNRRAKQLRNHPLCQRHQEFGEVVEATVADHIERHNGDEDKFFNGPLQSLCKPCHDSYKQRLEKSGTVIGCTEDGTPIDPGHHWHGQGGGQKV